MVNQAGAEEAAGIYTSLRTSVLHVRPDEVGLAPSVELPHVWGVVTDIGHPGGVATVVALADGTTSLYLSTGGGTIGGGGHAAVVAATMALLNAAQRRLADLPPTSDEALPAVGRVVLRALTYDGQRAVEAGEEELHGQHPLSDLYRAVHAVITELRLIEENRPDRPQ